MILGEKRFKCEICFKEFLNYSTLVLHIRRHKGRTWKLWIMEFGHIQSSFSPIFSPSGAFINICLTYPKISYQKYYETRYFVFSPWSENIIFKNLTFLNYLCYWTRLLILVLIFAVYVKKLALLISSLNANCGFITFNFYRRNRLPLHLLYKKLCT